MSDASFAVGGGSRGPVFPTREWRVIRRWRKKLHPIMSGEINASIPYPFISPSFQLDRSSFLLLRITDHNYDEVNNLTLDSNRLDTLPEKLLDMELNWAFSARNNQLTDVSNVKVEA